MLILEGIFAAFAVFYTDLIEQKIQKRGCPIPVNNYNLLRHSFNSSKFFYMSPPLLRKTVCPSVIEINAYRNMVLKGKQNAPVKLS